MTRPRLSPMASLGLVACLATTSLIPGAPMQARPAHAQALQATKVEVQVSIEGRTRPAVVDLGAARVLTLDFSDKNTLDAKGRAAVAQLAAGLTDRSGRFVVFGSNDDASAAGRAGATGFRNAKAVRAELLKAGFNDDQILVAGWRAETSDPGMLHELNRGGRILVAPLSGLMRVISTSPNGDPGRAMALDSVYARLATASIVADARTRTASTTGAAAPAVAPASLPVPAPAPARPSPAASQVTPPSATPAARPGDIVAGGVRAPAPVEIRLLAAPPVAGAPVPAPPPVAVAAAPVLISPAGAPARQMPRATVMATSGQALPSGAGAGTSCAPPAIILNDFYRGGPFRDCEGRPRSLR